MREFLKNGHIFIVCAGLLLFWLPLFSRKGGSFHRRAGRAYAAFMAVAVISGLVLAAGHLRVPEKRVGGIFLFYAALVLFSCGRHGLAVLKAKSEPALLRTPFALALDWALLGGGALIFGLGASWKDPLLMVAGPLGFLAGLRHRRFLARESHDRAFWVHEHILAMIATGIAGYTAFIFFEAARYWPGVFGGRWGWLLWLLPLALGWTAIAGFHRRYRGGLEGDVV